MRTMLRPWTWGLLIFPICLTLLGLATIEMVFQEDLSLDALLPGVVLALGLLGAQAGLAFARRGGDPYLLSLAAVLTALSLIMTRRLVPDLLWAQTVWALVGLGAMLLVVGLLHRPARLRRYKYTWALLGLILVVLTLFFGVAPSGFGPRLWLTFNNVFYFQPSELLKVFLVIFFAGYLAEKRELLTRASTRLGSLRVPPLAYVGPLLMMWGLSMALLVWQRDLGAALLFLGIFLAMLYVTSGRMVYVLGGLILFLAGAVAAYVLFDHVRVRADIWLNPWAQSQGAGYQVVQGLIALAAGGLFGTGLGRGYPGYIPAVHTDYVFAALGEELGLVGLIAVLALYLLLVGRGFRIARRAQDSFEVLLAVGLTSVLGLQTLIIVAGVLRLIPLTGITLPFVSYGGSSLLTNYLIVGLLLRLSAGDRGELPEDRVLRRVQRLATFVFLGFVALAVALPYWQVWHAQGLLARPDNPRRVEALRRTRRGRILDANGVVLAHTEFDDAGLARRVYAYPPLAATVGYASWRHGSAGLEWTLDDVLMGRSRSMSLDRFWDGVVGRPTLGEDAAVTLDLGVQRVADEALGDRAGVVLILDAQDGRVLALASHPTTDPNRLGDDWEALAQDKRRPMLNRATEGLYPPGPLVSVVTLAAALDAGLVTPTTTLALTDTIQVGEVVLTCPDHRRHTDLDAALADGCPVVFARLGLDLGAARWSDVARRLGLGTRTPFELPTLAGQLVDPGESLADPPVLARAAAGAGPVVTPLQVAQVALALTGTGSPHLLPGGAAPGAERLSPSTAAAMRDLLARALVRQGLFAGGYDAAALLVAAPTPAGGEPDAWFVGVTPGESPRYVVVVLVEQSSPVESVVGPIARQVLDALTRLAGDR